MAQVKFLKPVSPYNAGEVAELSDEMAKKAIEQGICEPFELVVEEKKTAKKAESAKVE